MYPLHCKRIMCFVHECLLTFLLSEKCIISNFNCSVLLNFSLVIFSFSASKSESLLC